MVEGNVISLVQWRRQQAPAESSLLHTIKEEEFGIIFRVMPFLCGSCRVEKILCDNGDIYLVVTALDWGKPAFRIYREDGAFVVEDIRRPFTGLDGGPEETGRYDTVDEVAEELRCMMGTRRSILEQDEEPGEQSLATDWPSLEPARDRADTERA